MPLYYRHVSIVVFFHVLVCSLLLRCMLESSAGILNRVGIPHQGGILYLQGVKFVCSILFKM